MHRWSERVSENDQAMETVHLAHHPFMKHVYLTSCRCVWIGLYHILGCHTIPIAWASIDQNIAICNALDTSCPNVLFVLITTSRRGMSSVHGPASRAFVGSPAPTSIIHPLHPNIWYPPPPVTKQGSLARNERIYPSPRPNLATSSPSTSTPTPPELVKSAKLLPAEPVRQQLHQAPVISRSIPWLYSSAIPSTMAASALNEERELAINPIVGTSVQHNNQVRHHLASHD
jgi:hypothetical protein